MPKEWSKLQEAFKKLDLSDCNRVLMDMGHAVILEIHNMVERQEQPDGSPQKQNTQEYAEAKQRLKGYKTPLKGVASESPYLSRKTGVAWIRQFIHPSTLHIYLNTKRWYVGYYLQQKGYWFMGITDAAYRRIKQLATNYLRIKLRKALGLGYD